MNIGAIAKQYQHGAGTLVDWLGEGGATVSQDEAERRALTCIHCPKNVAPNWLERNVTNPIAIAIKKQLELKRDAKLSVTVENDLHVCSACGCYLPTKIWTPIAHIAAHTSVEVLGLAPDYCWFKKEIINEI